ncbi:hypothetical protein ACHWQZ_G005434 [Mnemiopsis leidyi]
MSASEGPKDPSEVALFFWLTWLIIVLITSFLGDVTILVASIRYGALKLHSVIVVIIQNIAISDLIITTTCVLPQSIAMAAESKELDQKALSYPLVYGPYLGFLSSKLFVLVLIVAKWLILKYPLKARTWTESRGRKLCGVIWVFCVLCQARFFVGGVGDIKFDRLIFRYNYAYSHPVWRSWLSLTYFTLTTYIPNLVIFTLTLFLIKHLLHARKVTSRTRGNLRWQGMLTVVVTATVYSLSYLPYATFFAVRSQIPPAVKANVFRFAATCGYFNIVCNFFIYSLTVQSFNSFLKVTLRNVTGFEFSGNARSHVSTTGESRDQVTKKASSETNV